MCGMLFESRRRMIKKNSVFEYILFIILTSDYHSNVSNVEKKKKKKSSFIRGLRGFEERRVNSGGWFE